MVKISPGESGVVRCSIRTNDPWYGGDAICDLSRNYPDNGQPGPCPDTTTADWFPSSIDLPFPLIPESQPGYGDGSYLQFFISKSSDAAGDRVIDKSYPTHPDGYTPVPGWDVSNFPSSLTFPVSYDDPTPNQYGCRRVTYCPTSITNVRVTVAPTAPSGTYSVGFRYYPAWNNGGFCDPRAWFYRFQGLDTRWIVGQFTIPGPLTGTVSVSKIASLQACVDLKADASKDQKVVSVDVDWGDGSSHYTTSPNTQHYFASSICHTYASAGTYTITTTYKDDVSPTPNSISPTTSVTVNCINSASMGIESSGSSNGKNPTNGIYTRCYSATVTHSTVSGESYSYTWTFPDNTTVNSGGGANDKTASFCIATTNINAPSNIGVVSCKITKTTPTPSCDVTVSSQVTGSGGTPPSPTPPGPDPGPDPEPSPDPDPNPDPGDPAPGPWPGPGPNPGPSPSPPTGPSPGSDGGASPSSPLC